jgi:hypothetical protein
MLRENGPGRWELTQSEIAVAVVRIHAPNVNGWQSSLMTGRVAAPKRGSGRIPVALFAPSDSE